MTTIIGSIGSQKVAPSLAKEVLGGLWSLGKKTGTIAFAGGFIGSVGHHIWMQYPAPSQPPLKPDDRITTLKSDEDETRAITKDTTGRAWRMATEQDDQEDIRTVLGYSGHARGIAYRLVLEGQKTEQMRTEAWITQRWDEAESYSQQGRIPGDSLIAKALQAIFGEYNKGPNGSAVAIIASKRLAEMGPARYEGNPHQPHLPLKEDGYVAVAVIPVTPDNDDRFLAKTARCFNYIIYAGLQDPESGQDQAREGIKKGPLAIT